MAKDVSDAVRDVVGRAVREAVKNVGDATPAKKSGGRFSGAKGIAAGAGLAAAAPLAKKGMDKVRLGGLGALAPNPGNLAAKAGEKVSSNMKDAVSSKVDEAGGAGGIVKEAASGLLPGGGGDDGGGSKNDMPGVGKGRRMPIEQSVHVGAPIETVYNQFTQFEDWPQFMHRVTRVTQDDECTINFATKIWGKTKEYTAKVETQRPDERVKWRVSQGITHTGVVTFHELGPRLTMVMVTLDVDPGSLIEKAARGMRHIKRAVRADLSRFKAFIEMSEMETGAWRGVIIDGEVVEPHDDEYDEERDYADIEEIKAEGEQDSDDDDDEESGDDARGEVPDDEELPRDKTGRFTRGAGARSDRELKKKTRSGSTSNGSSKPKSSAKPKSSSSRTKRQSTRTRGSSNGNGSSSKRSSGASSRRRTSSRS